MLKHAKFESIKLIAYKVISRKFFPVSLFCYVVMFCSNWAIIDCFVVASGFFLIPSSFLCTLHLVYQFIPMFLKFMSYLDFDVIILHFFLLERTQNDCYKVEYD